MKYIVSFFLIFLVLPISKGQNMIHADSATLGSFVRSEENLVMVKDSQENILPSGNEYSFSSRELLIYPIKTSSVINVILTTSIKKVYAGEIRDLDGIVVKSVPLDALNNEISLKDLNDGRYTLRITSENAVVTEVNIIKEPAAQP